MDYAKLVEVFLKIRERRSELKREFEAQDEKLKADQAKLEAAMLQHLNAAGLDSARTAQGTFYKQESLKPSASDWVAVYDFIKDNDAFDMLERRIKKDFVKDYMEMNEGVPPPGVSVHREYEVRVRRA